MTRLLREMLFTKIVLHQIYYPKMISHKKFIQELYYHKPATQKQINTINNMVGRYISFEGKNYLALESL